MKAATSHKVPVRGRAGGVTTDGLSSPPKGLSGHKSEAPLALLLPQRVQLRRIKGWRMPSNTIKVTRPGPWGNPYPVDGVSIKTNRESIGYFWWWLHQTAEGRERAACGRRDLVGKNLACFCGLDEICHADVWLYVANRPPPWVTFDFRQYGFDLSELNTLFDGGPSLQKTFVEKVTAAWPEIRNVLRAGG